MIDAEFCHHAHQKTQEVCKRQAKSDLLGHKQILC